jgi:adenylosuccinate synthase
MPITVIAGGQWGDEGKGKLVDALAGESDYVVRFQGGANAGHSIHNDFGRFVLHMLPSGAFRPGITNIIAAGVALDVPCLMEELATLRRAGAPETELLISDRARLVLDSHRQLDHLEEERLGTSAFGSTRRGIAPFYAAKALKIGIPIGCCADEDALAQAVGRWLDRLSTIMPHRYGVPCPGQDALMHEAREAWVSVRDMVTDTGSLLREAVAIGKHVMGECQLGALRDVDHGIIPWTTSTSTLSSAIGPGAGIPAQAVRRVVAAVKGYSSCVGEGPLLTEIQGAIADHLRRFGQERASTTGRTRRVGWFDAVATRYGCSLQGATEVALTMVDALSGLDRIRVCTAYQENDRRIERFPLTYRLSRCEPTYEDLPGWSEELGDMRRWEELPEAVRNFVRTIEGKLAVPIRTLSVGPHRRQLVEVARE